MDNCTSTHKVSGYLDGRLTGEERREMAHHLSECDNCVTAAEDFRRMRATLRSLPKLSPPRQLQAELRVAASRAAARRAARATFPLWCAAWKDRLRFSFQHLMRPIALPLTGGLVSAGLMFGMLAPSFALPSNYRNSDVPTVLATQATVKGMAPLGISDSDVIVDLTVDEQGRMVDYTIIEGQGQINSEALRRSLENSLLFTEFNPATSFGQPMSGRIRVSFRSSRIDVRG